MFLTAFAVTLVAGAIALFLDTERRSKALQDSKVSAETMYSDWETQNDCIEEPQLCADYSEQFKNWLAQFEQYIEHKKQKPEYQYYLFLKDVDEQYVPDLNLGGLASLGSASALLLLFVFSIVYLLGGKKKTKAPSLGVRLEKDIVKAAPARTAPRARSEPEPAPRARAEALPDINVLLRKATDCSESEPMQAISYLEQALEGSLGTKLSLPALLLCGSLRLKNKIGEDKGREQLKQIISASPESPEAKKAQIVLDTIK